jgi:APA family basic amino acid/polyamine antiporter
MQARAIVMPLPARTGGALFGRTAEYVLAHRPCRVILQSDPTTTASKSLTPAGRGSGGR